ncbi:MAG: hypothetical protein R2716_04360 [Microthrixaceae bacterium]
MSDATGVSWGAAPIELAPRCQAQRLGRARAPRESWGDVRSWLVELFRWAGLAGLEAEELAVLPGFEELIALMEIGELARSGRFDAVVVAALRNGGRSGSVSPAGPDGLVLPQGLRALARAGWRGWWRRC